MKNAMVTSLEKQLFRHRKQNRSKKTIKNFFHPRLFYTKESHYALAQKMFGKVFVLFQCFLVFWSKILYKFL